MVSERVVRLVNRSYHFACGRLRHLLRCLATRSAEALLVANRNEPDFPMLLGSGTRLKGSCSAKCAACAEEWGAQVLSSLRCKWHHEEGLRPKQHP